ncbi:MAG: radical SAM family heme chaperone HemW [Bacteroidales bacterium]|jgi:oxygen-independent coproporphyrinogen-3 oxidase|nr:radical SAM family heme chaperone HemW [Bacteroidales bacterium]
MAGIYIHIPFCKSRCIYCDFYSSTQTEHINNLIEAECTELKIRADANHEVIETIYFGGGTPSLLKAGQLSQILNTIYHYYSVAEDAEITLEANPDDVSKDKILDYVKLGINRISLGIQSFDDEILRFLSRRHNALKAEQAVIDINNAGIENTSIDLIYGIPQMSVESWQRSLEKAVDLPVKHISAYHLTIEEGTPLSHLVKENNIAEVTEETSVLHFRMLREVLLNKGFKHYEVSNFSLPGWESKHNSSYWCGKKYIGIGPSAHSFDGEKRRWNIASTNDYIKNIHADFFEEEKLTINDRFNEYLLTRLRTKKGADLNELQQIDKKIFSQWEPQFNKLVHENLIKTQNSIFYIEQENWLMLDYIIRELFV